MKVKYEVIISKHGSLITMATVKTLREAYKIKDNLLESPCHSGEYIVIEKTETTRVSRAPFTGANLTY